ncbi:MAG: hypothetical protein ACI86M_001799 [Saprospiraceae bacterium]|jgi:hypothetical protein
MHQLNQKISYEIDIDTDADMQQNPTLDKANHCRA